MESIIKRLVELGYDEDLAESMARFYEKRGEVESLIDYIQVKENLISELDPDEYAAWSY